MIIEDRLGSGYIFFGIEGLGKWTFAKCIAYALETKNDIDSVIAGCFSRGIGSEKSPPTLLDTMFVDEIEMGIDSVRTIKHFLSLKPVRAARKIVVVNNADRMTVHAQHALLKIIEESSERALTVFVAREENLLLPTVRSRLTKIYFRRAPREELTQWLVNDHRAEPSLAYEIVGLSHGSPGRAITLYQNPKALKTKLARIQELKRATIPDMYSVIKSLKSDDDVHEFLECLLMTHHDPLHTTRFSLLKDISKRIAAIKSLNVNKRLQLEAVAANLAEYV